MPLLSLRRYPYSRHHQVGDNRINYIRNSVKVVIDAYNGSVAFYVFDSQDPLIATYRSTFPSLFQDASAMPADLRCTRALSGNPDSSPG